MKCTGPGHNEMLEERKILTDFPCFIFRSNLPDGRQKECIPVTDVQRQKTLAKDAICPMNLWSRHGRLFSIQFLLGPTNFPPLHMNYGRKENSSTWVSFNCFYFFSYAFLRWLIYSLTFGRWEYFPFYLCVNYLYTLTARYCLAIWMKLALTICWLVS